MSGIVGPRISTIPPVIDPLFKMTVDTTAAGGATAADQFEIRLHNGTTNFTVYWGDGNSDVITVYNQAELTHTYAVGGTYQISIDGSLHGFFFQYRDDGKVMSIDNWGTNVWGTFSRSFHFCSNMVANYTDTPDTSAVTDFSSAFAYCTLFNGSMDGWDTSSATNMIGMFQASTSFNQPLNFDTSSVTTFNSMFKGTSAFNQPINFDGSSLTNASYMFINAGDMNSSVTITNSTLLTDCSAMFAQMSSFNADITLTTTNVTTMQVMFSYTPLFNGTITFNGGTGNVTNMASMFVYAADFNQPLTFLNDTSNVTNMSSMFRGANEFNQSVSGLNTSSVTSMNSMFRDTWVFNQPVPFDTTLVTDMSFMFFSAMQFNQAINFTTPNLTNLMMTFLNASQLISVTLSDTSNVTTMQGMFQQTGTFNQDISSWDITSLTTASTMFTLNTGFSQANYDLLLVAWNAFGTSNVPFHAGTTHYSAGAPVTAHNAMVARGWTITDGGTP